MPDSSSDSDIRYASTTRLWYFIFASIILLWYVRECILYSVICLDVSVGLACAQQLLEGQKMFLDVFEINPPLKVYFSTIPMLVSNVSGLEPSYTFVLFVIAVAAISMTLSTLALRGADEREKRIGYAMLAACFTGFVYSAQNIFGQREQTFVMLYLPFFLVRWMRCLDIRVGVPLSVCAGILAGIGCSFKPYFAVILLSTELAFFLQYRRASSLRGAEVMACLAAVFAYLVHFLFWDPVALRFFFTEHIPSVTKYYHFSDCSVSAAVFIKSAENAFALMTLSGVWASVLFRREKLILVLLAWIGSSYLLFVLQMKGWAYQAVPLLAGIHMTIAALTVISLRSHFEHRSEKSASVESENEISNIKRRKQFSTLYSSLQFVVLAWFLVSIASTLLNPPKAPGQPPDLVPLARIFSKHTTPGDSVAVLGVDGRRLEQLLLAHRLRLGWRYTWGYPMQFLEYEMKHSDGPDEGRFRDAWEKLLRTALDDVRSRKPKLILMDSFVNAKLGEFGLLEQTVARYSRLDDIKVQAVEDSDGLYRVYVLREPEYRSNSKQLEGSFNQ